MLTDNPAASLILVVEDDANHADLIQRSFEDAPDEYQLKFAGNITAAKIAMELQAPSLVLTDYRLPDGEGSELVLLGADLWPVIIMTSYGSEKVAVEAMKIGALDYIVKSVEAFDNLPRTVNYALMSWALKMARRQSGEAVIRAKKDWERTFDAVTDLVAIIDINHTIIRVNTAMAVKCGFTPDELAGLRCCEVMHGMVGPVVNCPVADMVRNCQAQNVELEEKWLNGVYDITVSPLSDENGRITRFVHVMRDITERKRAEVERQALEAQFQQTQKLESLGVLAGGIAHDFNNILTIIMGHCYMVKDNHDSGLTDKDHIEKIESAANRAADLCRQMLAYAGNSPLLKVDIYLGLMVDEIVKMLQSAIKKNVAIVFDLKNDVPEITGDNAQIQQVIMNLIINAAEAIGDNNGMIRVALHKTEIQVGNAEADFMGSAILPGIYACLEVTDDGCGMDKFVQSRIFEPFFTTKFTGRGLGMSAILGIIKSHNGALQLSSTPAVGTTFKVYFPVQNKVAAINSVSVTRSINSAALSGTVLLVDDEEALCTMGSEIMGAMGIRAITASNGLKAVEQFNAHGDEIDLVILDLIMPEMGGIEAYRELRKIDRNVPIIICSGYDSELVSVITTTDDKSSFLHKPYNPAELRSMLKELLNTKF